jgi:hypothetical protein
MMGICGMATFHSSPQNAGTGYYPMTTVGGPWSPADYLNRMFKYVRELDAAIKKPTTPDQKINPGPKPTNIA